MNQNSILFPEPPWQARGIFSTHYLAERLPKSTIWPNEEQVKPAYDAIKAIYDKHIVGLRKADEPDNEDLFINPVFKILGFGFLKKKHIPGAGDEPDYLLYPNESVKSQALGCHPKEQYATALTIGEAKRWDHPLDKPATGTRKHSKTTPKEYPFQQIRRYLNTIESTNIRWGILTNGKEWRLYYKEGIPRRYFEISLEKDGHFISLSDFKYFYALFRPDAFIMDASGKCSLDKIYNESLQFYEDLEKDLKKEVFDCLELLAKGFINRTENNLSNNQSDLDQIYKHSLILLYRILFVLNAEARNLLSTNPQSNYYKHYGLQRLKEEIPNKRNDYLESKSDLHNHLSQLFHLINGSNPETNRELKVPAYNGGLFDPNRYGFLEEKKVGDKTIAEVLFRLAYRIDKQGVTYSLDYKDLGERHLGSIYEAILEHKLVKDNGNLILQNDKGERKATGAYFTPDYIVKYIVEHTVGTLVKDISARVIARSEIPRLSLRGTESRSNLKTGSEQAPQSYEIKDGSFADEILKLKILDPAMGSGHFLVETIDYLAEEIAAHPNTKQQTESGRDEEEVNYWKRRVVESCVFGVDIKELAVELAKLSLWLKTVDRNQPLSFLDHHLKCGNSLIGAKINDLRNLPNTKSRNSQKDEPEQTKKQAPLFKAEDLLADLSYSVKEFLKIAISPSTVRADIKKKEKIFESINTEHLDKYRKVANLWTSVYFGIKIDENVYKELSDEVLGKKKLSAKSLQRYLDKSDVIHKDKHFFHWELEFPEVFFNEDGTAKENPGFDAVIGNPPWGVLLEEKSLGFLQGAFEAKGWNDSYAFFMQSSIIKCRRCGLTGMIVPSSWLTVGIYEKVRQFLLGKGEFTRICYLYRVFDDVNLDASVFIHKKESVGTNTVISIAPVDISPSNRLRILATQGWAKIFTTANTIWKESPEHRINVLIDPPTRKILHKTESVSTQLSNLYNVGIGIQAYCHPKHTPEQIEKRVFHSKQKIDKSYMRCLSGNDVGRYEIHLEQTEYLSIGDWLYFTPELEVFQEPRVLAQQVIWKTLKTCLVTEKNLVHYNSIFHIWRPKTTNSLGFINAVLNSFLIAWVFPLRSNKAFGEKFPKLSHGDLMEFPIRRIAFVTPKKERERLVEKFKKMYQSYL